MFQCSKLVPLQYAARLNVARLNVARLNVARLNVVLNVARLNVARQNVACYKSDRMSPDLMLPVPNVARPNVTPFSFPKPQILVYWMALCYLISLEDQRATERIFTFWCQLRPKGQS
jgi:hypothetical protein